MKKLLIVVTLLLGPNCFSQWTPLNDFGGTERFASVDFVNDQSAYIIGGIIESGPGYVAYNEVWKYNSAVDMWTKLSPYPGGKMYAGIAFVINDVAYVGLGANQLGVHLNQLWALDLSTGNWTQKANFPGNTRNYAFSMALNDKGYVGCGVQFVGGSPVYLDDVWEYDPLLDSWLQVSNYPGGGKVGMTATSINGKGYVGLGDDGSFYHDDFYEYDATSDTWQTLTTFPGENRSFYNSLTYQNNVYIVGGEKLHASYSNEMWFFDPGTMTWNNAVNFAGVSRGYSNFFVLNSTFYYGLGLIGPSDSQGANDMWKYTADPTGVNELRAQSFSVFPNPFSDKIYIDGTSSSSPIQVQLHSMQGQLIESWSFEGIDQPEINVNLPSGMYYMEIKTTENKTVHRIIRQ